VDFHIHQHRILKLTSRLNLMVVLVMGLLSSNVLLAGFTCYALLHQKVEITPFMGGESYQKTDAVVDTHYLMMMSENFLYARLNVTPETVITNHNRLLSFVDAKHHAEFATQLQKEAQLIQKQQLSSHFDVLSMQAKPAHLTCVVQGILKRNVGRRELPDEPRTYTLKFNYHLGRLTIQRFAHQPGVNHA